MGMRNDESILAQTVAQIAIPLDDASAYDALFDRIGDARFVLLGKRVRPALPGSYEHLFTGPACRSSC